MTTHRHVIILAQGQQTRLPKLDRPKQLLELAACADTPIIIRTLCQVAMLGQVEHHEGFDYVTDTTITVVCAHPLRYCIEAVPGAAILNHAKRVLRPYAVELKDPGNSSLKGIRRFLRDQDLDQRGLPPPIQDRRESEIQYVVLLGDVVYSWDCLRKIFAGTHWHMGFVGSGDLSKSAGELYGVSWKGGAHDTMLTLLDRALEKHPPSQDVYQCGQLRRWLWEADILCGNTEYGANYAGEISLLRNPVFRRWPAAWTPAGLHRTWYVVADDYTDDVDVPEDVYYLPQLAKAAAADDAANGLRWGDK